MPRKHHLPMVTAAEGTDADMKKTSSDVVTEVVVQEIGTAPGEKKRRGMPAAGGTGMRTDIWKLMRMLTRTGVALGKSVIKEIKLISATGNAMPGCVSWRD